MPAHPMVLMYFTWKYKYEPHAVAKRKVRGYPMLLGLIFLEPGIENYQSSQEMSIFTRSGGYLDSLGTFNKFIKHQVTLMVITSPSSSE